MTTTTRTQRPEAILALGGCSVRPVMWSFENPAYGAKHQPDALGSQRSLDSSER